MNLRQKTKQAKKEYTRLVKKGPNPLFTIDAVYFDRKDKLRRLIERKRHVQYMSYQIEPTEINFDALTYIAVRTDKEVFGVLSSCTGRPLLRSDVGVFINQLLQTKILKATLKVLRDEPTDNAENLQCETYYFTLSSDKTKSKKLTKMVLFMQYQGSDKLILGEYWRKPDETYL